MDIAQNVVNESVPNEVEQEKNSNSNPEPNLERILESNHEPNPPKQKPENDTTILLSIIRQTQNILETLRESQNQTFNKEPYQNKSLLPSAADL